MKTLVRSNDDAERFGIEALYQRGFSLHADNRFAEAAGFFRAMLRAAPTDERGWLALGNCHEKIGQHRVALELYTAGTIAARPAPRCLLSRFRALYDMNRLADAQRAYDEALKTIALCGDDGLASILEGERWTRP